MTAPKPVILCILDGWGYDPQSQSSAIKNAQTPVYDRLMAEAPFATLDTSGKHVGLPDGQMGNSEVGHMNLGSGRVVLQDLPRIDEAVERNTLKDRPALQELIAKTRQSGGAVHLMGLVSPGGVHSHQDHMAALAHVLHAEGLTVHLHAFLDGRDTPPQSARGFVEKLEADCGTAAAIATVSGRFYAMDRDKRWDRVEKAYRAIVLADGAKADSALEAIDASYSEEITDEFVVPAVIGGFDGIKDGDAVLMANFRADRAREILTALTDLAFDGFDRSRVPDLAACAGMVEYSAALADAVAALFPPESLTNVMAEFLANQGKRQLHIAETEKYAHVTFFFNGGREDAFEGEERVLIPSPKVATYDLQPEMSAGEVTGRLCEEIAGGRHDFIVVNYANPDMVGHTGIMPAAVKAVETIDACLGRLEQAVADAGGVMLVTADHGNVEQMLDPTTGAPHTAHTSFVVPLLLINAEALGKPVHLTHGRLADIAPTCLHLMGLVPPAEMTGTVLVADGAPQAGAEAVA